MVSVNGGVAPFPARLFLVTGAVLTIQLGGARCDPDRPRQGERCVCILGCCTQMLVLVTPRRSFSPSPPFRAALRGLDYHKRILLLALPRVCA